MEDLSALIFVALAIAWASYLIPKALHHHDDAARSRSVDRFSGRLRVLALRDAAGGRSARLVPGRTRPSAAPASSEVAVADGEPEAEAAVEAEAPADAGGPSMVGQAPPTPGAPSVVRGRREAARRAARRRRRVLALLLVALAATAGVAGYGAIAWAYVAIPAGMLVAWLVACRLMVRSERKSRRQAAPARSTAAPRVEPQAVQPVAKPAVAVPEEIAVTRNEQGFQEVAASAETANLVPASSLWDPVPVTLPTYVGKAPAARRTVRTIDLDDTGVWTSGRTQADADLAREADLARDADQAAAEAEPAETPAREAVGS